MKKIILFILIVIPVVCTAGTIKPGDIVGEWVDAQPYSIKGKVIKWLASPSGNKLEIKKDFSVKFTRIFDSGEKEIIETNRSSLEVHDDLYIIKLPRISGDKYKIVLSGWKMRDSKMIFGHFYLYNKDGLFNGWRIALVPEK